VAVAIEPSAQPMTCIHSSRVAWWILITALIPAAFTAHATADTCTAARNQDGISLCQTTIEQSAFVEVIAETVLCTSSEAFQTLLNDVDGYKRWIPSVLEARALSKSTNSQIYYVKYSTPWPFKPRDMIYRMSAPSSDEVPLVTVTVEGLPEYIEPVQAVVRLKAARGSWHFSDTPEGLLVVYTMYVDAGNAPAAIANRRLKSTVSATFANLRNAFPCT
jgi:hypothetical protein